MSWSMEQIDLLCRLWTEGYTCSQIAYQIGGGKSRNAVIGKVHRLRLAGRVKAERAPYISNTRAAAKANAEKAVRKPQKPSVPKSAGVRPMKPAKPVLEAPTGPGVPLWEMTGCKFSIREEGPMHFFCNAPKKHKSPWCEYHHAVCHQKVNPDKGKVKRFKIPTSLLRAVA